MGEIDKVLYFIYDPDMVDKRVGETLVARGGLVR